MKTIFQVQNRALGFIRLVLVLLLGAETQHCCCGLCLPDCCSLPPFQPNSGYSCCPPPSYCVQNVVVGSQDSDKVKNSNSDPQTDDPPQYDPPQYDPQDVYCCRDPRVYEQDPAFLRQILCLLQQQSQNRNSQSMRRVINDPSSSSNGMKSFSDPSTAYSSSGMRSFSDPSMPFASSGLGSYSDSSMGGMGYFSSALRNTIDPGLASRSNGFIPVSDPTSLLSSSRLRSSYLSDPYCLSQISDPQTCCSSMNNYYDPSGYSYDPCCNICNPCCRLPRQPCCKKCQRRVILIDNVTPDSCFV